MLIEELIVYECKFDYLLNTSWIYDSVLLNSILVDTNKLENGAHLNRIK